MTILYYTLPSIVLYKTDWRVTAVPCGIYSVSDVQYSTEPIGGAL